MLSHRMKKAARDGSTRQRCNLLLEGAEEIERRDRLARRLQELIRGLQAGVRRDLEDLKTIGK